MITLEKKLDLSPSTAASTVTPADATAPATVIAEVANSQPPPEQSSFYAHSRQRYVEIEELLEFAVEKGKLEPPSLAGELKSLKKTLYYLPEAEMTAEKMSEIEASLELLYLKVGQVVAPVTIETLRASSGKYLIRRTGLPALFLGSNSLGRNFLRQLFWVGVIMLCVAFLSHYFRLNHDTTTIWDRYREFMAPFFYGAIGAWIYLYRTLTDAYFDATLNPNQSSTYWLRIFMGALSGGLFVHLLVPQMQAAGMGDGDLFAQKAAVGLLAGYSVDFFYITLDRLIQALVPKGEDGATPPPPLTAKQMQMEALLKRLQEAQSEEDKATIRRMLEKL